MILKWFIWLMVVFSVSLFGAGDRHAEESVECVILLHGLARTSRSMQQIALKLEEERFQVVNVDYPSRKHDIGELAHLAVSQGISQCPSNSKLNFVTHSLGGILVRYYYAENPKVRLGRVVMLAPPNQGSEVVDRLRNVPGFDLINGPAGSQLGTDGDSIPQNLGLVDFELGIIAGTQTINPILSQLLPNPDDGKVSVNRTKVDGMADFVTVPHSHALLMDAPDVLELVLAFLNSGSFELTGN